MFYYQLFPFVLIKVNHQIILSDFKIKLIQRIFCDSDPCQT